MSFVEALDFKIGEICEKATEGQVDGIIDKLKPYIDSRDYVYCSFIF